jgi:hypothetical protein
MNTNLSISSWNVDGLGDKCKDDLFLSCMKYDINILLETWKGTDANINIPDFKFYKNAGKNREGQNGSAVVLLYYTNQNYLKEYMNYKICLHLKIAYGLKGYCLPAA